MAGKTGKRKSYQKRGGRMDKKKKRKVNTTGYNPVDFKSAYVVKTNSGYLSSVPIPGGIAPRLRCRLIYEDTYTNRFDGGVTTYEEFILRLNSIYDYDYSNLFGNFQPAGRDRLALIYSLYLVRGVKITFEITNGNGNAGTTAAPALTATWVAWPAEQGTVLPSVPSYPDMLPGSRTISIPVNETRKMTVKVNTEKMSGLSGSPFNSGLGANTGDNPGKPLWGYLKLLQNFYNAGDENHYNVKMRAVFDVEYAMPKISAIDTN